MRSKANGALVEADGPSGPVSAVGPEPWHHWRDRGWRGAGWWKPAFGLPRGVWLGRRGQRDAALLGSGAPRGLCCGSGPEPIASACLERHGGFNPAAGGFTVRAENVAALHSGPQWAGR